MPDYDNRNTFALFRNTKKRDGKNDPDFTGTFTDENGREFFMDAWARSPKNGGEKFLGGTAKLKQKQPDRAPPKREMAALDDEVPF